MGFIGINEQNKQRISLQLSTYNNILQDIADFNLKGYNELVNNILTYVWKQTEPTEKIIDSYRKKLTASLSSLDVGIEEKESFINHMVKLKQNELLSEINSIGTHQRNNKGLYIRISNSVRRFLESDYNHENQYYNSLEQYINYQLTNYASLDYCDRETIALNSRISKIQEAIASKAWLDIIYPGDSVSVRVCPIVIDTDILKTHTYLACYRLMPDNSIMPTTYRLSSLNVDFELVYNLDYLDDEAIIILKNLIQERGIQFLTEPATEIKAKLTLDGVKNYNRTAPLRPIAQKIESLPNESEYIYTFFCTERQAEYYFTKFGKDVEILSPCSLRNRLIAHYQSTLAKYLV